MSVCDRRSSQSQKVIGHEAQYLARPRSVSSKVMNDLLPLGIRFSAGQGGVRRQSGDGDLLQDQAKGLLSIENWTDLVFRITRVHSEKPHSSRALDDPIHVIGTPSCDETKGSRTISLQHISGSPSAAARPLPAQSDSLYSAISRALCYSALTVGE